MPECKHLNARVYGHDIIGTSTCPDCGTHPQLYVVFNNWLDEFKRLKGEMGKKDGQGT